MTSDDSPTYFDWLRRQAEIDRCKCELKDVGYLCVCKVFEDDDEGDCLTCGHKKECHANP